eukprot:1160820-Pelagomonas_calceolata.AAC.5
MGWDECDWPETAKKCTAMDPHRPETANEWTELETANGLRWIMMDFDWHEKAREWMCSALGGMREEVKNWSCAQ